MKSSFIKQNTEQYTEYRDTWTIKDHHVLPKLLRWKYLSNTSVLMIEVESALGVHLGWDLVIEWHSMWFTSFVNTSNHLASLVSCGQWYCRPGRDYSLLYRVVSRSKICIDIKRCFSLKGQVYTNHWSTISTAWCIMYPPLFPFNCHPSLYSVQNMFIKSCKSSCFVSFSLLHWSVCACSIPATP